MTGYILPYRDELKVKDWERFRAAYCGLCHTIGARCGFTARFLLSYDFTLLALLLEEPGYTADPRCRRCIAAPWGRQVCQPGRHLEQAADATVILSWWKLQDQYRDETGLKRIQAGALSLVFRRAYRKAAARRPDFDANTSQCLEELHTLEAENSPAMDRAADTFARILSYAAPATGNTARDRALKQLLYHVGRWIYLVDAWDDLEDDIRTGNYNPVARRYGLPGTPEAKSAAADALRLTLKHSVNLALSAFHLLEERESDPVVENILCLGMPLVEHLVFTGQWREQRKKLGRR